MISGRTRVFAILGDPVSHSLSPAMHNAAFHALGAAQLGDPVGVVAGHRENEIGAGHQVAAERARPVGGEVQVVLEPDKIRALRGRGTVPCAGARGGHPHLPRRPARREGLAQQRLGQRTTAGVAGADEENVHRDAQLQVKGER